MDSTLPLILSPSSYHFSIQAIFNFTAAFLSLAICFLAYSQNRQASVNKYFLLTSLAGSLWLLGTGLAYLSNYSEQPIVLYFWVKILLIGAILNPAGNYAVSVYFTHSKRQEKLIIGAYLISILFLPFLIYTNYFFKEFTQEGDLYFIQLGFAAKVFALFAFLLAIIVMVNFIYRWRITKNRTERRILSYIIAAYLIAYLSNLSYLPAFRVRLLFLPEAPGFIFILIWSIVLGYIISRYQILDVKRIVVRAIGYVILTSFVLIIFGSLFFITQLIFARQVDLKLLFLSSLLFTLCLPLFEFLHRNIQFVIARLFARGRFDFQKSVRLFHHQLREVRSREELISGIYSLVSKNIFVRKVHLMVFYKTEILIISKTKHRQRTTEEKLLMRKYNDFFEFLSRRGEIIIKDQLTIDPKFKSVITDGEDLLNRYRAALVMPLITSHGSLLGLLLLGYKEDEKPFTPQDIELLATLTGPISIALENTEFYENIKNIGEMKSQFVSIASHQMRTPLSILRWSISLLKEEEDGKLNEKQKAHIIEAQKATERMIALIDNLLRITELEHNKIKLVRTIVNLQKLVKDAIAEIESLNKEKGIVFCTNFPDQAVFLPVDVAKLKEVFLIVLDNAVRYSHHNSKVIVSLSSTARRIEISIKDYGIGIPQNEQRQLFNKFYRGSTAVRTQTSGSGLGLFIAKTLTELHNGKIWVESEEGQGTTVYITLPFLKTT